MAGPPEPRQLSTPRRAPSAPHRAPGIHPKHPRLALGHPSGSDPSAAGQTLGGLGNGPPWFKPLTPADFYPSHGARAPTRGEGTQATDLRRTRPGEMGAPTDT